VFCGIKDVPLEAAAIIPISRGGTYDLDNFLLLCPNCHAIFDHHHPNELEFIEYLVSLLRRSPKFRGVDTQSEIHGKELPADIRAEQQSNDGSQYLAIECKSYTAFSTDRLAATVHQISTYRKHIGNAKYVLAFLGRLSERHRKLLSANGVELWDIDYLAHNFHEEIKQVEHPYFQSLLLGIIRETTLSVS
jgi:hypothetical protein